VVKVRLRGLTRPRPLAAPSAARHRERHRSARKCTPHPLEKGRADAACSGAIMTETLPANLEALLPPVLRLVFGEAERWRRYQVSAPGAWLNSVSSSGISCCCRCISRQTVGWLMRLTTLISVWSAAGATPLSRR